MQPDPATYLMRARQEIQATLAAGSVTDPAAAIALDRIAEMLAQLALRTGPLPAIVGAVQDAQQALLRTTLERLDAAGIAVPAEAAPGVALVGAPAVPGQEIASFDALSRAQAHGLRALGDVDLCVAARGIEASVRAGYRDALEREKAAFAATAPREAKERLAPPTPAELESYLRERLPGAAAVRVLGIETLRGVNTKDILFLTIDGVAGWPRDVVMRRLRAFNVNEQVDMAYEFALSNALAAAGIAVPRTLLVEEGAALGQPFLMLERLPGAARKAESLGGAGRAIAEQMAQWLGRIHALDPAMAGRAELALAPRDRLLAHVGHFQDSWNAAQIEASPIVEAGYAWIRARAGRLSDETVLVHGDYDLRNLLVDGDRISAVLDWERSHVGHPAEDLAYCRTDIEKLMPWDAFLAIYVAHGGRVVDEAELQFFSIWAQLFRIASITRAHGGFVRGDHSDFLLGTASFIEFHKTLDQLEAMLAAAGQ